MKIAQIAPLAESVPPRFYGGTERIVSYLTEELVHQGHDVTLFASGDSQTRAELVPITDMALRLNRTVVDTIPYHMMMLEQVRRRANEFDALHFHIDMLHLPMVQDFIGRTVTTLHGRLDLPDLPPFYRAFPDHSLVSISDPGCVKTRLANLCGATVGFEDGEPWWFARGLSLRWLSGLPCFP